MLKKAPEGKKFCSDYVRERWEAEQQLSMNYVAVKVSGATDKWKVSKKRDVDIIELPNAREEHGNFTVEAGEDPSLLPTCTCGKFTSTLIPCRHI